MSLYGLRLDWRPVESSNLAAVALRADTGDLYVRFRSGRVYRYDRVGAVHFAQLLAAPSKGRYLNDAIKGEFPYTKVG